MCPLAKLNFDLNGLLCSECRASAATRLVALHNRAVQHIAVAARSYTLKINAGVLNLVSSFTLVLVCIRCNAVLDHWASIISTSVSVWSGLH